MTWETGKKIVLMYDGAASLYAGAEMFFINAATELSKHGFSVTLVDREDSIIPRHLVDHGVPFSFVPFRKGRRIPLPGRYDYLLVTNTKIFHCCRLGLNWDCKVLVVEIDKDFWDDRHGNDSVFHRISNWSMRRWRQSMIDKAGLSVLEASACRLAADRGYRNVDRMALVPLMAPDIPEHSRIRRMPDGSGKWRFLGIARDTEYKIAPLAYFFPRIRALIPNSVFKFVTHNTEHAKAIFENFGVDFVECVPGMPPEELNGYMDREADCVVAMGTTSINAATLGIPTLVGDATNEWPYPTDKFRWVHDSHENLGEYITSKAKPSYGITVAHAVEDLKSSYEGLSKAAIDFVAKRHSPDVFAESMMAALASSKVSFIRYRVMTKIGVLR